MELLDLLFNKDTDEFYIVVNEFEVMTENGNFISLNKLDKNLLNLGSIDTKPKMASLFKI